MESLKSKRFPAFFKPIVAQDWEQRLLIPSFFSNFMEGRVPSSAFLRDLNGKLWRVKVVEQRGYNYFVDGWSKFVQEKNVKRGDLVVFSYDGKSFFDVKVFGQTACEKDFDVRVIDAKVKEEQMEEDENEDEESDESEESDEELREAFPGNRSNEKANCSLSSKRLDDEAIFDLGIVGRPKNPYFVTKLDPKRMSDLRIPKEVIRDFDLRLPKLIDICDKDGRVWGAVVKKWHDGRHCITKGWRAFCKWNGVKPDDKCLCEFVPGNGESEFQLKVCIVRASTLSKD